MFQLYHFPKIKFLNDSTQSVIYGTLLSLMILLLCLGILSDWYEKELKLKTEAYMMAQLSAYSHNLMSAINDRFSLMAGLKAFVKINQSERIKWNEFNLFASGLYAGAEGIRNFSIAPEGIQGYVYPLSGNEKAIGHNLIEDPRPQVRIDIQRTIKSQQIALSGPYELRQGGLGLIAR